MGMMGGREEEQREGGKEEGQKEVGDSGKVGGKKGGNDKKRVSKRDPGTQSLLALRQEAEWSVELGSQQGAARSCKRPWETSTTQAWDCLAGAHRGLSTNIYSGHMNVVHPCCLTR